METDFGDWNNVGTNQMWERRPIRIGQIGLSLTQKMALAWRVGLVFGPLMIELD